MNLWSGNLLSKYVQLLKLSVEVSSFGKKLARADFKQNDFKVAQTTKSIRRPKIGTWNIFEVQFDLD